MTGSSAALPLRASHALEEPASQARGGTRRGGWITLLIAAIGIALSAGLAISALRHHADERRAAELALQEIEAAASTQAALTWQALAGDEGITQARTRIDEEGQAIAVRLDQLASIDQGGAELLTLYRSFEEYQAALRETLTRAPWSVRDVSALQPDAVRPAFEEFRQAIQVTAEVYASAAMTTSSAADAGTLTTLVSAAVLLVLFFNRSSSALRSAAVLAGQQRVLRASEERFRSLVQRSSDTITVIDGNGIIRYQSDSVEGLLGIAAERLLDTSFVDLVHTDDAHRVRELLAGVRTGALPPQPMEWRLSRADGSWVDVETIATDMSTDPRVGGVVLNSRNVSERKMLEARLTHQAYHDPLTGLPNRIPLRERIDAALAGARRDGSGVAVLLLDLDNFKTINDSLGHAAGDEFLVLVSQRLRASIRPGDIAARLGGDEFAVLLEESSDAADAARVANRIAEQLAQPSVVRGHHVSASASIGIAISDGSGDSDELVRNADTAMYQAKAAGGSRFVVFEPAMHEAATARLELESQLRGALDRGEFRLVYQPILNLVDGSWTGIEALIRWHRSGGETVMPGDFIAIAEQIGAIEPIGWWVVETAIAELAALRRDVQATATLTVSVNVSARQLHEATFAERLELLTRRHGLEPHDVVLELTESALMDVDVVVGRLADLRGRGFHVAADDFGTGHSSLSRLREVPVDMVKIDRSFIALLAERRAEIALVRAMVELAAALGLRTIAEGVEEPEQLEVLRQVGCESAQGFLLSRPIAPRDLRTVLAGGPPAQFAAPSRRTA